MKLRAFFRQDVFEDFAVDGELLELQQGDPGYSLQLVPILDQHKLVQHDPGMEGHMLPNFIIVILHLLIGKLKDEAHDEAALAEAIGQLPEVAAE